MLKICFNDIENFDQNLSNLTKLTQLINIIKNIHIKLSKIQNV